VPDQLGAPHQITNASAQVVWLWDHDPFGNGAPTGSFTYDLRFPGQFYDQHSTLHYNYFRDYDPRTGRYIESDPIGLAGGINTYGYVRGNPVGAIDLRGLDESNPMITLHNFYNIYENVMDATACSRVCRKLYL
jgi:RHS repeat-associated protein